MPDCPEFEYDDVPGARATIEKRAHGLVANLLAGRIDTRTEACDGRPTHAVMLAGFAPADYPNYIGHYRGDAICRCLAQYTVGVEGDPRVGEPPGGVAYAMTGFVSDVTKALAVLDAAQNNPGEAERKLYSIVVMASRLFERFLRIHPYANGNGHMARWLMCVVLARYGHAPRNFTIEPRPEGPYAQAIIAARNGNHSALERFMLGLIKPAPPPIVIV